MKDTGVWFSAYRPLTVDGVQLTKVVQEQALKVAREECGAVA